MGIDASKFKLTAAEAYNLLDQKDGNVGDGKIGSSVWNNLINSVEYIPGDKTDNDIEENKAMDALRTFLQSSGEKYLNQLYKFLGYNIEEAQSKANDNVEKAEDVLQKVANGEIKIKSSKMKKNEDGTKRRDLILENGMTIYIFEDANGKITEICLDITMDKIGNGDVNLNFEGVQVAMDDNKNKFELYQRSNDHGGYDFKKYQDLGKQIVGRVKSKFIGDAINKMTIKDVKSNEFIASLTPEQQQDIENGMSIGEFNEKYSDNVITIFDRKSFGIS